MTCTNKHPEGSQCIFCTIDHETLAKELTTLLVKINSPLPDKRARVRQDQIKLVDNAGLTFERRVSPDSGDTYYVVVQSD